MDPKIHSLLVGYVSNISELLGRLSGSRLLKVCVDISHQVKAIEVTEICFEEAAITDTRPARCCVRLQASMVYLLVVDCC